MKLKTISLFLLSVFVLSACDDSDSDSNDNVIPSPIHGSWGITTWEIKTQNPPSEWMPYDQECRLDDVEEYKPNGNWTQYDGTFVCEGGDATGTLKGTWKFAANNTKLLFTYDGIPGEYQSAIDVLTDTSMVLTFGTGTLDGMQNRVTYSKL